MLKLNKKVFKHRDIIWVFVDLCLTAAAPVGVHFRTVGFTVLSSGLFSVFITVAEQCHRSKGFALAVALLMLRCQFALAEHHNFVRWLSVMSGARAVWIMLQEERVQKYELSIV